MSERIEFLINGVLEQDAAIEKLNLIREGYRHELVDLIGPGNNYLLEGVAKASVTSGGKARIDANVLIPSFDAAAYAKASEDLKSKLRTAKIVVVKPKEIKETYPTLRITKV